VAGFNLLLVHIDELLDTSDTATIEVTEAGVVWV